MDTNRYTPEEPIAAIATALAPAALGIIRTSGKNSRQLIANLFSRPDALLHAQGNTVIHGWIHDKSGNRIDEVVVSNFCAPKSFTGEDMVEISCHGGIAVVTALFNLLVNNGFRQAERGEFTFRAYLNGKTDLTKAEAVREIIDAKTDVSRSRAAGRLAGNLFDSIDGVKKRIIETLGSIEVEIEYPEDEETIADTFDHSGLERAALELERLASSWKSEKLYQDGARVVLCGPTNAGKSSLFNALLKEDRAIVSDIAGTTRDWLESWINFDGVPARIFDTAGLRETSDTIEQFGVERTRDLSRDADVILYLIDSSVGLSTDDSLFIGTNTVPLIFVKNKCDIVSSSSTSMEQFSSCRGVYAVSAKTGEGISPLCTAIHAILVSGAESDRNMTGLGSERQKNAVESALESVRHAISVSETYTLDAVVQDLEDALDSLGLVTGAVTSEDILGSIFSRFCVGK